METKYFYRFRSVDKLLGTKRELETQTIYFAEPATLNDPMEGYKDIFWEGDEVLWEGFLRNFLYVLTLFYRNSRLDGGANFKEADFKSLVVSSITVESFDDGFLKIFENFIRAESIVDYIKLISNKRLSEFDVLYGLRGCYKFAFDLIVHQESGSKPLNGKLKTLHSFIDGDYFGAKSRLPSEANNVINVYELFIQEARTLSFHLNDLPTARDAFKKSDEFISVISSFPERYLKSSELLMYPEWYTACFMGDEKSSSVWGHYGDNHKGVCLKFKSVSSGDSYSINFTNSEGLVENFILNMVDYERGFPEIDYFLSLGRFSNKYLQTYWLKNCNGVTSERSDKYYSDIGEWRKQYWVNFIKFTTTKTDDWRYEKEYRLILSPNFESSITKENRVFKYDLSQLDGIIFGINTLMSDKVKIIEIIREKCKTQKIDCFNFYQAFYSKESKKIENFKMVFDVESGVFSFSP